MSNGHPHFPAKEKPLIEMLKLLRTTHGSLLSVQFKNPTFLTPISHLHDCSKTLIPDSGQGFVRDAAEEVQSTKPSSQGVSNPVEKFKPPEPNSSMKPGGEEVRICHPWPEWVELMKQLFKNGYFESDVDFLRKEKLDSKEANRVRTACLNFARDRSGLMRYFSRKDIHLIVGYGCPNTDRKVVNSGKRLRAYVGIREENVCDICSLRGVCERARVYAHKNEDGCTSDVMRFLLTFGLDSVTGLVENKPCVDNTTMESARRLLKQIVDLSKEEGESDLSGNSPVQETKWKNSSLSEGYRRKHGNVYRLKKGDWICHKCNLLNFAKNSRCIKCNGQLPKRQLGPGEWECDSCNYINFRRNTTCLKCEYRPSRAYL